MERCGCEAHNSAVKASSQPIAIITLNRLNLLPSMDWTRLRLLRRYLNATILHGLFLSSLSDVLLLAFSDADWAGCPLIVAPLVVVSCISAILSSLGVQRSNLPWSAPAVKQNTKLLPTPRPGFFGRALFDKMDGWK